jgi:hypothetical protein
VWNFQSPVPLRANDGLTYQIALHFPKIAHPLVGETFLVICSIETKDVPLDDIIVRAVAVSDESDNRGDLILIEGNRPIGELRLLFSFCLYFRYVGSRNDDRGRLR